MKETLLEVLTAKVILQSYSLLFLCLFITFKYTSEKQLYSKRKIIMQQFNRENQSPKLTFSTV